jgi:hypothetical protein
LFHDYEILHDYFGRGQNDVMKRLKNLKEKQAILVGEKNERNKTKSPGS